MTPILSMLRTAAATNLDLKATLFHHIKYRSELYFNYEMQGYWKDKQNRFQVEVAFTQEGDERFTPEYMISIAGVDAVYYICGP